MALLKFCVSLSKDKMLSSMVHSYRPFYSPCNCMIQALTYHAWHLLNLHVQHFMMSNYEL